MSIIQPVNFLDEFVSLCSETNRLNMEVREALVEGIYDKVLVLKGDHLWEHPGAEQLTVERGVPRTVHHFVGDFELDFSCVWLDLSHVKEHLVDLTVRVGERTAQIVALTDCLLHFQGVNDSKGHIVSVNRLHLGVHVFNQPVHPVEHFHLHAPLSSHSRVLVQ